MKFKKIEHIELDSPVDVYDITVDNKFHNFSIASIPGEQIYAHNCDEINEKGVQEGMELLNSIDGRLDSRFKGSDFVFQNVMSSARSTDSVTREYVKKWQKDPSFLYLHPMRFEVKQSSEFVGDGTTFSVQVGNGVIPNKIITDPGEILQIEKNEYVIPNGCELVHVPSIYKNQFEADLDQQIQDILGIDTQDQRFVFRDTTTLEDDILLPEMYLEVNINENTRVFDLLPHNELFEQDINGKWRMKRAPNAERYCHWDYAGGGSGGQCDAAFCLLHKEWRTNKETNEKETIYVTDLMLSINAKNKIDIEALQNLAIDLVIERNVPIYTISADQYQSLQSIQRWESSGCFTKVEKVSVDSKLEPYTNAAMLIESDKVKVGQCPKLKKELEALILDKSKVTKTTELKDMPDALVGAIYNAQIDYIHTPLYQYLSKEVLKREITFEDLINTETEFLASL